MLSRIEDELELFERHLQILKLVIEKEPIGIIKLSEIGGMPQHKIRYSLRILEQSGMIKPSQRGAITTQKAKSFLKNLPEKLKSLVWKIQNLDTS
jgi:predicted transcriptional regulator